LTVPERQAKPIGSESELFDSYLLFNEGTIAFFPKAGDGVS